MDKRQHLEQLGYAVTVVNNRVTIFDTQDADGFKITGSHDEYESMLDEAHTHLITDCE